MKFKTKNIEVEAERENSYYPTMHFYIDGKIKSLKLEEFEMLFEPVEEESDKQDTVTCDS